MKVDKGRTTTDKELRTMEKKLTGIYSRAEKEVGKRWKEYMDKVNEKAAKLYEDIKAAKTSEGKRLAEKAYKDYVTNATLRNQHFKTLTEQYAKELLDVNKTAVAYVNGKMPDVYAANYNAIGTGIQSQLKGYSFELVDAATVKSLATKDETLLPYKIVNGKKDVRWNTSAVNNEVLQGIIQGESIPDISKRLRNVTEMNLSSSIRNARTSTTSAENRGRIDSFRVAQEKGVVLHKIWMATEDGRTREAHILLDGQEQEVDEPFDSELGPIMYPGDPNADPANVYNCRCTMVTKVLGFGAAKESVNIQGEQIEFSEKLNAEKWNEPKAIINELTQEYNTKLQTVLPGAHKGAGDVQISGSVMHLSSSAPEVAMHEFAHTISIENQTKFGLYDEADFWKEIKRVYRQYRKEVGDDVSRWISSYEHGSRSIDEFMAEAFAQAKMSEKGFDLPSKYGKDLTYSMRVLEIVDKYFKKK